MQIELIAQDRKALLDWYRLNKRALPWRKHKDPYLIWISEVMLQQTTVTAVIPFYERFITRFPNVQSLAEASLEDVYGFWAGLGYYSRARNLHKAAQTVAHDFGGHFPLGHGELIHLAGFGPYTSRAVASIAQNEPVGVLDGNVIRILTRKYGLDLEWWNVREKKHLQHLSDQLAATPDAADVNQAMMELGATVCTPKKVLCLMCPWNKSCDSFQNNLVHARPKSKPRPAFEAWHWRFEVEIKEDRIFLVENKSTPFLKNNWLPVSSAQRVQSKPKNFTFKHGVTKYDIYVDVVRAGPKAGLFGIPSTKTKDSKAAKNRNLAESDPQGKWVAIRDLPRINPTSLARKILEASHNLV